MCLGKLPIFLGKSVEVLPNFLRHDNTRPNTPPTREKLDRETLQESATDSSGESWKLSKYTIIGHKSLVTFLKVFAYTSFYINISDYTDANILEMMHRDFIPRENSHP